MSEPTPRHVNILRSVAVVAMLFVFLVGIRGLGTGFKLLGKDVLDVFFEAAGNPFIALVIGILATTLVQSSSVTTSMIVGLVAAPENPLPVAAAVPMIMGANIGTTVTNTVVSLGHIGRPLEFKRAFGAATCHDFFNFMAVALLLPLEIVTGVLERSAGWLSHLLVGRVSGGKLPNPIKDATKAVVKQIEAGVEAVFGEGQLMAVGLILVSIGIIFVTLALIVRLLRAVASRRMEQIITRSLDANPFLGILVGIVATVMVQSSSVTTSVLIPLAGAGIIGVRQVFPIVLGANLGTTVTALLASLAADASRAEQAVQIALVHLLFNMAGILLIYPNRKIRSIPVRLAERLAETAVHSRRFALLYVVLLFYGVPALLVFLGRLF